MPFCPFNVFATASTKRNALASCGRMTKQKSNTDIMSITHSDP